ncbi:MAG: DUF4832 domain-containing protein [Balneolales bacterium]
MLKVLSYLTVVLSAILFISCNQSTRNGESTPRVVEAESMHLTGYEIENVNNRTYIKLADSTGTARFNFPYASGYYDIDVSYLSESVGQNIYTMNIANNQIVAWLGKSRDDQWHMLSDQRWHAPRHIEINEGDEIRIEALSENGSLVIFDFVQFTPSSRVVSARDTETISHTPAQTAAEILSSPEDYITVYPEEYERALKNPLKGFRPSRLDHEYGTLTKTYFRWNDLESTAGDGVSDIINASNERWKDYEKTNMKAIPRVYLDWPGRESGWPSDMTEGDYTSDEFKERVIALIKKLAQAWDNDPRVAYVEMGLIGEWGEQEFPDTRDDIKEAIAAQFAASFQNKLVMIRWPNTYNDHIYNFGYYWDSFGHHDQEYYAFHLNNTSPRWETAVIGGETAYNWGNAHIQPGESPEESLSKPVHRDFIIDRIRKLHANHLGWIANYDHNDEQVRAGAELVQKAMGYRFVLTEVSYPKTIDNKEQFTFSFKVKNTGSTPFYYNWPIEVSLLDPDTKEIIWKEQLTDIDIRTWLPGDKWDDSTKAYTIPAETYTVNQTMTLSDVAPGAYIFALSVLDPAGNQPGARFAIKNYYNGGRHPIGKVGVEQVIESYSVSGFNDIQKDNSLFYVFSNN